MPRLPYRGDRLQASRDRVSAYWKRAGWAYARRLGKFGAFGVGSVLAAGAANYFAKVPKLDQDMRMIGYKRSRAQRRHEDKGGYVQLSYDRQRSGKYLSRYAKLSKMVNSHTFPVIERFQNVTQLSSGAGAYPLTWDQSNAAENVLPCYLFDLTCIKNRQPGNNSLMNPAPFMRLYRNKTNVGVLGGAYLTFPVNGRNADNTEDTPLWQIEKDIHATGDKHEKALIEWCDIRLVLYGARLCPSWVQIMVVQFLDDDQTPASWLGNPVVAHRTESGRMNDLSQPAYNKWQQGWQGFIDNCVGNVINVRDHSGNDLKLRVKYSKTYKFNPTMSTEDDRTGHQVAVKYRYNMNKICTYMENPYMHQQVTATEEDNPNEWSSTGSTSNNLSVVPAQRGREFLIIKGYTGSVYIGGTSGNFYDYAPSFDMIIRRKRSHMR